MLELNYKFVFYSGFEVLGNHEFDDGVEGLLPFLKHVHFPVISANIDMSGEPQMAEKVQKSIVVQYEGRKVGIIGYTTKETPDLSDVGNLIFEDEIIAVTKEAKRLNKNGIKIIIAVGHSGYDLDMKVAKIPFIDVVVGGHTNTFLYTGKPLPDIELPAGKYPTVIESNGRNVPVVQAYAFGKYLGYLNVTFNNEGDVISWAGNPILLDSSIPQDLKMEAELERKEKKFLKKMKREVGKTEILLDGLQSCRMKECIMGNVLADAIVEYVNNVLARKRSNKMPRVSMSILSGGMLRASIPSNRTITLEDCLTVFPFSDTIDVIEVTGKHLRTIFEFSMAQYHQTGISHTGKFLQVSGIRVTFDLKRNPGNRVVELSTLLPRDGNDTRNYELIQDEQNYMMGISSYTASGGDGYQIIPQKLINKYESNTQVFDALLAYIRYHSPISRILGNRTQLLLDESKPAWSGLIK